MICLQRYSHTLESERTQTATTDSLVTAIQERCRVAEAEDTAKLVAQADQSEWRIS